MKNIFFFSKKNCFIVFFSLLFGFAFCQGIEEEEDDDSTARTCSSMDMYIRYLQEHPEIQQNIEHTELKIFDFVKDNYERIAAEVGTTDISSNQIAFIPVVVHVLWNEEADNISNAQILSQIDILNEDFNKQNSDISNVPYYFTNIVGNVRIKFCLANIDPDGNATTGITRTHTDTENFFIPQQKMKYTAQGGHDAWNTSNYLNIWVVPAMHDFGAVAGVGQFPRMGAAETDGVVIGREFFGNIGDLKNHYAQGRTATHEVGHWLNLFHIWGEGKTCSDDDLVEDTPLQKKWRTGCPSGVKTSCSNGPCGDMYMNFMDYVYDACMVAFTHGQAARIHAEQLFDTRSNFFLSQIKGNTNVCINTNATFNVNTSSLFTYSWSTDAGTIIGNNNSNMVTINASNMGSNKKVYLSAITPCGDEVQRVFTLNVGSNGIGNLSAAWYNTSGCHYVANTNTLPSAIGYEWSDNNFNTFSTTVAPEYGMFAMEDLAYIAVRARDACGNVSNIVSHSAFLAHINGCGLRLAQNGSGKEIINIFPNPNKTTELNIELTNTDNTLLRILDITGKEVYNTILEDKNNRINTDFLQNGIYFIEAHFFNHQREIIKLVIEK